MQAGGDVVENGTSGGRKGSDQKVECMLVDRFMRYYEAEFCWSVALWLSFLHLTLCRFHQCFQSRQVYCHLQLSEICFLLKNSCRFL